ncbi:MAG: hypothetical protein WDZ77_02650 [Candidatus Pacearchaeota archaeon]
MSGGVWYLSFRNKKIEFSKFNSGKKNSKKPKTETKKSRKNLTANLFLGFFFTIFFSSVVLAVAITDDLHLNIQTTDSGGGIVTGSFDFAFNISTAESCSVANVIYSNTTSLTTDTRGVISYYLPNVTLDYDEQYWLCYYRDGILQDASKISRTPYAFTAQNITLSGVDVDTNFDATGFNVTADSGFFIFLGNLANRVTNIFSSGLNVVGDANINGTLYVNGQNVSTGIGYVLNDSFLFNTGDTGTGEFIFGDINISESTGRIGVGTAATEVLDVAGNVQATGAFQTTNNEVIYAGSTLGQVRFSRPVSTDDIALYAGGLERIRINGGNGFFGINTTIPQTLLHVAGNALFNGTINTASNKIINLADGTSAQDAVTLFQLQEVNATANLTGGGTQNRIARFLSAGFLGDSSITDDGIVVSVNNDDLHINTTSGNVGVNTNNPGSKLEVDGTFEAKNNGGSMRVDSNGDIKVGI